MNGSGGGGGGRGGKKVFGMPLAQRKDRDDEDLVLFRELDKRERDRIASLLLPVSEEFEPNAAAAAGNYAVYRIASRKKGSGYEFFAENDRNDYDWLKTPPATPLFPSLEMEAKAPELVVQREIPILQSLSRFSGNSAAAKNESTATPRSPKPKPKIPIRPITPSHQRLNNTSNETRNTKTTIRTTSRTTGKERNDIDFITSNLSKDVGLIDAKTKARIRGVSPSLRSTIPAQLYGFSNDPTPPNLRTTPTDRSTSAARNRPAGTNSSLPTKKTNGFSDDPPPPNLRTTSATRGRPVAGNSSLPTQFNKFSNDPRTSITTDRSTSAARNRPTEIKSSLSTQISHFSNDPPPPNLKTTDISTSTTRGRSQNPSTTSTHHRGRKESRSPSVTRGRKVEMKQQENNQGNGNGNGYNLNGNQRGGRFQTGIVGSRMVEKMMNARKYSEEKETKTTPGFGRNLMSKTSLDIALKHAEMKRDKTNSGHQGTVRGRSLARSSE